jgi:hypothetical protein
MPKASEATHPNAESFPKRTSGPALRALAAAGVRSIRDLTSWTEQDVAALHGMGPKVLGLLKDELKRRRLKLRS